ncbi:MAG: hypothetical protein IJ794_12420 [Lachnospiraceae bacterium]|nr:hypothetical protein [Lachnospiraceae bacterium]
MYSKMLNYGADFIDENGKTAYIGNVERGSRLDIVIDQPVSGKSSALVDVISQKFHSKLIDNDEAEKCLPKHLIMGGVQG